MINIINTLFQLAGMGIVVFLLSTSIIYAVNDLSVNQDPEIKYLNGAHGVQGGYGYSSDRQQITQYQCYDTTSTTVRCESKLSINELISFDQLLNTLKTRNYEEVDYFFFSRTKVSVYLKSIKDQENTLSLNYVHIFKDMVDVYPNGYGIDALTQKGKDVYENDYKKFGLVCGDNYISRFTEGAMLMISLNIHFNGHDEKENFIDHSSKSALFNIYHSTEEVKETMRRCKINGSVDIKAYQYGGEPGLLSNILKEDHTGYYYSMTYDMAHIQDWVNMAKKAFDYGINDFSKQVSCNPPKGLYPLDTDYKYEPISRLTIEAPNSLITSELLQARQTLTNQMDEYNNYIKKITEAIDHYPISWDKNSSFYQKMQSLAEKVKNNLWLLQENAEKCFKLPYKCDDLKDDVQLKMMIISPEDLKDLPTTKEYTICSSLSCFFYERGVAEHRSGNYSKAIEYYTRALNLNDVWISENRLKVLNNRGDSYYSLNSRLKA